MLGAFQACGFPQSVFAMQRLFPSAVLFIDGLYSHLDYIQDNPSAPGYKWLVSSSGIDDGDETPAPGLTLSWTAPTGGETIVAYRLEWGTAIDGEFGIFINSVRIEGSPPVTSYEFTDPLPTGDYAFQVIAIDNDGEESNPTLLGVETIV